MTAAASEAVPRPGDVAQIPSQEGWALPTPRVITMTQLLEGGRVEELEQGAAAPSDRLFASHLHPCCLEIF